MLEGARAPLAIAQMIETEGVGGAEALVLDLCTDLQARGHRVIRIGPVGGEGWLSNRLGEVGFEPHRLRIQRPLDPPALWDLVRVLRESRVDVVHSHDFTCAVYGTAATRWLGVPHVITMHGDVGVTDAWRRRAALRWAIRHSAATWAVSEATRDHMEEQLALGGTYTSVIYNGVDPSVTGDAEAIRTELGLREGDLLVLCVGSLYPLKGHRVVLEALARLEARGEARPWRLAIAGRGAEREALVSLARRHDLGARVHLLGMRSDVPALLGAADIFAMPSLREGLPLSLLEAMMAGKAIVASAVGGIPEAIESGVHGLLVPPGEVEPLAKALEMLLSDPQQRARLGDAGRERAARWFTKQAMMDRYEQGYRDVLGH